MKKKPSAHPYLDVRHPKTKDTYPVQLRITADRKSKYYTLALGSKGIVMSKSDYIKVMDMNLKVRGKLKEIRAEIMSKQKKAEDIISELPEFTFSIFENKFLDKIKPGDVIAIYQTIIREKRGSEARRIGTASSYECSMKSLQKFFLNRYYKEEIKFSDLTEDHLREYTDYMKISNECSDTTIGIYFRALRAVFNRGIKEGQARKDKYPFGKDKVKIPKGGGRAIALTMPEMSKIFHFKSDPQKYNEAWSRDIFIFSYLCYGMNLIDIARLKYKNIINGKIEFERAKTQYTRVDENKVISCKITPHVQKIIDTWGNEDKLPDSYIFNILHEGVSAEEERKLVQNATFLINFHLKKIAEQCNINKPLTTYTARHSYASIGTATGVPVAHISKDLGHSSLLTTQAYIEKIETDEIEKARQRMMDFHDA